MPQATDNFTPRFQTLAAELIADIQLGHYRNGQMFPSERELGLRYNVSRQTIRNALKILADDGWAYARMGKGNFVVSPPVKHPEADPTTRKVSKQIGVVWGAEALSDDLKVGSPLLGLKSAVSASGYSLSLSVASKDEKNGLYPLYPRWLREDSMDGYILVSAPAHAQEAFAESGKPALSLGYLWTDTDLPSVDTDFREIWRLSIRHLTEKSLFPICNFLARPTSTEEAKFSEKIMTGIIEEQTESSLTTDQFSNVDYEDTAFGLISAIRRIFKRDQKPKSIILSSGRYLDEVFRFFEKIDLKVPDDVFILVVQPTNIPTAYISRLSYFDTDVFLPAKRAGEKMLEIIMTGETTPRHEHYSLGKFIDPI